MDGQISEKISFSHTQFIKQTISQLEKIPGIDLIYFVSSSHEIIEEKKIHDVENYLEQVLSILVLEPVASEVGKNFYSDNFHTYTMLSESGLVIILKLVNLMLYMVIIAGENEPVDLINLLKICKETRVSALKI